MLELKPLPFHLKYAYLGENLMSPIIVSTAFLLDEEEKLFKNSKGVQNNIWIIDN